MAKRMLRENFKLAFSSVKSQKLRTWLTALIISFGIMALVGILSATDAIKQSLSGNFSSLGANTFTIRSNTAVFRIGNKGTKPKVFKRITYDQAVDFKDKFNYGQSIVSVNSIISGTAEIKYLSKKTDPNVQIWAVDESYLRSAGYEISEGRGITKADLEDTRPIAIVGIDVVEKLFPNEEALGKTISYRGRKLKIVGILKSKGSSMGFSSDRFVYVPLSYGKVNFLSASSKYAINIMANSADMLDASQSETVAIMRAVRKLKPKEEDNFVIQRSDSLAQMLIDNLSMVSTGAIVIGIIALFSAAIALMNIMLVSVTERTREIGTQKAVGASSSSILTQFLIEAILICQMGGIIGVVLGIGIGNLVARLVNGVFFIPWLWIIIALIICIVVGMIAGLYPALRASRQNPIEALRYE